MDMLKYELCLICWIRGVDVVVNEMYVLFELFVFLFCVLVKLGIVYFIYYVGEDFFYLISGIWFIDDVLRFLFLCNGDCFGYCIVIGIMFYIWKCFLLLFLFIIKEIWLFDLVFIWWEFWSYFELLCYVSGVVVEVVSLVYEVFLLEDEILIIIFDKVFELWGMLVELEGLLGELNGLLKFKFFWLEEYESVKELVRKVGMKRLMKLYY